LETYKERFRLFLLEERKFPIDVALITKIVPPHEPSLNTILFPHGGRTKAKYHQYSFTIPGITFDLSIGQRIPPEARRCCTAGSPEGTILYTGETLASTVIPAMRNPSVWSKLNLLAERREQEPDEA
jgi:hypothetical protein